jgi:hypothetical protein
MVFAMQGYQTAGLITEEELSQIRQFERSSPESLKEVSFQLCGDSPPSSPSF